MFLMRFNNNKMSDQMISSLHFDSQMQLWALREIELVFIRKI